MVAGVIREGERDSRNRVSLGITRQGASFGEGRISLLADTGVRRTILNLWDLEQLGRGELKETRLKLRPYGTNHYLSSAVRCSNLMSIGFNLNLRNKPPSPTPTPQY